MDGGGRNTPISSSTNEYSNVNHFKKDSIDVDGSVNSNTTHSSPPRPPTPTTAAGNGGGVYDPKRIPSGVFASKSGKGIDWSTTSNESLFSIYMGNNSLSRDQIAMLYKSGELPFLDQDFSVAALANNNQQPPPGAIAAAATTTTWQPPLPPSDLVRRTIANPHININGTDLDNVPAQPPIDNGTTTLHPEVVPQPLVASSAGLNRNSTASSSTTTNRNSTSSTNSFQFPILQQEQMGGKGTRKVEAEQNRQAENKPAVVPEEEEEDSTTPEDKKQVPEEEEQQQGEQQLPQPTTEDKEENTSTTTCTTGGGRSSSWLACFPCFSKSPSSSTH